MKIHQNGCSTTAEYTAIQLQKLSQSSYSVRQQPPIIVIREEDSRKLLFARKKLLNKTIPYYLRALTYVRICCTVQAKSRSAFPEDMTARQPYLELLSRLGAVSSQWWKTCHVTYEGKLRSDHPELDSLLRSLARLS